MDKAAFNAFCASLPQTTYVVQWGGADVWKVGGKVFAIATDENGLRVSFKVSPIAYEILSDADGCRPAPYLASRGMKWIQAFDIAGSELKDHVRASYDMIASALPKKTKRELGFAL